MKKLLCGVGIVAMLTFGFTSCEQVEIVNITNSEMLEGDGVEVKFSISSIEQVSFEDEKVGTRAVDITNLCSRITLVFFQDGKKFKTINQKEMDDDFGTLQTTLPAGEYKYVVIAHNGNGNPTVTSLEEITFNSTVTMTDTFYYYGELNVTEPQELSLQLKRAVAMVRFVITDNVPEDVKRIKFYYTGGSSTFNAVTGFGSKESRQTEYRDIDVTAYSGESYYDLYTFPHATEDVIKLTVTAQTDDDDYAERVFEGIPVKINQITKYTGTFFGNIQKPGEFKVTMTTSDEWNEEELTY